MTSTVPVWIDDPTDAAVLAASEDRLAGFQLDPFGAIAERSGVDVASVSTASPSEIAPEAYLEFCKKYALDPEAMR